jgi:hypothetical protein
VFHVLAQYAAVGEAAASATAQAIKARAVFIG